MEFGAKFSILREFPVFLPISTAELEVCPGELDPWLQSLVVLEAAGNFWLESEMFKVSREGLPCGADFLESDSVVESNFLKLGWSVAPSKSGLRADFF